jgi:hypothetical protein
VIPEHRGAGLGRWVKALMLDYLMIYYPQVQSIRTSNALSNLHMRRINTEMGFVETTQYSFWQLELKM